MFGLFSSRSDWVIDTVVLATVLALPVLAWAIWEVRNGNHRRHRAIQLSLTIIFVVATVALEVDIRLAGGMTSFVRGGAFEGSILLSVVLWVHLAIACVNAIVWIGLPWASQRWFRDGRLPGASSAQHRRLGWIATMTCVATCVTGVLLYVLGFVL